MKTNNIILGALVVVIAVLFFLFGKNCNDPVIEPAPGKQYVDSLLVAHEIDAAAFKKRMDSAIANNDAQNARIDLLTKSVIENIAEYNKVKKKANHYASLYDSARAALDTAEALASCDQLRTEYGIFIEATDEMVRTSDSLIAVQFDKIRLQGLIIKDQSTQIVKQDFKIGELSREYYDLVGINKKLVKKQKRSWWKPVGAAVGAVLLMFAVK